MSKDKNGIYLGRGGRVFGPITAARLEQLKASGEILHYRYWWDPTKDAWQAVETPPPAPSAAKVEPALEGMPALCHDFGMTMVSGKLQNVTEAGCQLITSDGRELPSFGTDSTLTLNLADAATGQSLNVRALLRDVWRKGQSWVYVLAWDKVPSLSRD